VSRHPYHHRPLSRRRERVDRPAPRLERDDKGTPLYLHRADCGGCDRECNPLGWEQAERIASRRGYRVA
jgi:hypothetical protein